MIFGTKQKKTSRPPLADRLAGLSSTMLYEYADIALFNIGRSLSQSRGEKAKSPYISECAENVEALRSILEELEQRQP